VENFFIDTKDPLFSILFFILIVLTVVIVNYTVEIYKQKRQKKALMKFIENFENKKFVLDMKSLHYHDSFVTPLSLLAKSFESSGEYEKSIEIYLFLLEHMPQSSQRTVFMELLGKTYLHAGFMVKSRDVFLEILKQRPRNKEILNYLLIVYDQLKNYKKAKEIIEPLEILGEDVSHIKNYLDFKEGADIQKVLQKDTNLVRVCMKKAFDEDKIKAWEMYESSMFDEVVDILWFQSRGDIDFGKVSNDKELKALYFAKGYLKEEVKSKDFHINLLIAAKKEGLNATLTFNYICKSCKSTFPLSFERCPNCLSINSATVKVKISKSQELKSDSFS
jgi:tetratricopeptide (TPR) repeat protein